jgi:sodium/potassium-transporting ATPase subunit alpha
MLLSIAAKRMANRNVLVKDLRGVETLGAITCLATDKTGTLTRNQMTVTNIWSNQKMWDASNPSGKEADHTNVTVDYSKEGEMYAGMPVLGQQAAQDNFAPYSYDVPELQEIAHICYLCSKAKYDRTDVPIKQRTVIGDATETGLFMFAGNTIPESDKVKFNYPHCISYKIHQIKKKTHGIASRELSQSV